MYSIVSRALHSIAAHLHRYGSELSSTQDTLEDVIKHHKNYQDAFPPQNITRNQTKYHYFNQIASHLKQVKTSLQELEVKLQNIMALVCIFCQVLKTPDSIIASVLDVSFPIQQTPSFIDLNTL